MSKLIGKINLFIRNGQITFPSLIHLAIYVCIHRVCMLNTSALANDCLLAGSPGCSIVCLFDRLSPCRNVCIVRKMVLVITSIRVTLFQTSQTWGDVTQGTSLHPG